MNKLFHFFVPLHFGALKIWCELRTNGMMCGRRWKAHNRIHFCMQCTRRRMSSSSERYVTGFGRLASFYFKSNAFFEQSWPIVRHPREKSRHFRSEIKYKSKKGIDDKRSYDRSPDENGNEQRNKIVVRKWSRGECDRRERNCCTHTEGTNDRVNGKRSMKWTLRKQTIVHFSIKFIVGTEKKEKWKKNKTNKCTAYWLLNE